MAYFVTKAVNTIMTSLLKKHAGDEAMEALLDEDFQKNLFETIKTEMKRKLIDPNAPKRPRSAYIIFSGDHRDEIKKEMEADGRPTAGSAVTSAIGAKWREVRDAKDDESKALVHKYEKKAKKEKKNYDTLMATYNAPSAEELAKLPENNKVPRKKGTGSPRAKKDPNAPKGAKSAYMFYAESRRKELEGEKDEDGKELKGAQKRTMISEEWKALSKDDKKEYEALATEDKHRFEEEKAEYNQRNGISPKTPKQNKSKGEPKHEEKKSKPKTPTETKSKLKSKLKTPTETKRNSPNPEDSDSEVEQVEDSLDLGDVEEQTLRPPPSKQRVVAPKSNGKPVIMPKSSVLVRSVEDSDSELEND